MALSPLSTAMAPCQPLSLTSWPRVPSPQSSSSQEPGAVSSKMPETFLYLLGTLLPVPRKVTTG